MAEKIQLPATYKAAFHTQIPTTRALTFETRTMPLPTLDPNSILLHLTHTGICGTDLALAAGHLGPTSPILGHEGVGRIVALGSALSPSLYPLGSRVGVVWTRDICSRCAFCVAPGGETRCVQQLNSGRRGFEGSFAEYAVVGSGYVVWLPEVDGEGILRDEVVAPVLCGGVTAFAALKASGVVGGEWVVVSGAAGGVGALAVQYARAMGYRVVAVDAGSEKEEGCLRAGAEVYVDACGERLAEEVVMEVTEKGAAAVLVCAGAGRAYQTALGMLAPFGTLVCVGIPPPDQLVNFHPLLFIDRGIRIIGSAVGTRGDILEALEFVRRGLVKPDIKIIGLDDLNAVAQDFGKETGKYVIKF